MTKQDLNTYLTCPAFWAMFLWAGIVLYGAIAVVVEGGGNNYCPTCGKPAQTTTEK